MDEIKSKFLDLINKQNRQLKIPSMGFSDYFIQNVTATPELTKRKGNLTTAATRSELAARASSSTSSSSSGLVERVVTSNNDDYGDDNNETKNNKLSDQEILESIEEIYFKENCDITSYVLTNICKETVTCDRIQSSMITLKQQQKVISKNVLQRILEQRNACNDEFQKIGMAERELEESLWTCRKARSYLNYAKKQLTVTSLEILANYRKREILRELLKSLNAIKILKSADSEMQKLLLNENYSGAIALLLECKSTASEFIEYTCIQSLNQKLQETLILTEYQIETALNEMTQNFDIKKYAQLQEAYKLLNKSMIAMDQLHINFISAIHSTVNNVLRSFVDQQTTNGNQQPQTPQQKQIFEQLCENITIEQYIPCLIQLCKSFWIILASYYQIVMWHQNYKLYLNDVEMEYQDLYIQEKLKMGQSRIWNDIQSKLCIYLTNTKKIKTLKYEQFIQILSIIQRLKKIGLEFCGENSIKLIEIMKLQSIEFFMRYHISCLEEICLFLDNESWVPVDSSFSNILQLQEFRSVKHSLQQRHKSPPLEIKVAILSNDPTTTTINTDKDKNNVNNSDELISIHSQDGGGSSIYGSCGYFLRFSEKSSPFDGGLDATMFEEDVLSGIIIDEASCYFSEDSEDDDRSKFINNNNGSTTMNSSNKFEETQTQLLANSTSLNVLRCIGKYLQMCKLLHCISPQIVSCMLELIAFYIYAVHEIFGKDSLVPMENFYNDEMGKKLNYIAQQIVPKIKGWPLNFSSLVNNELCNPDTLFGLTQRTLAIESGCCMMKQFEQLKNYISHLLPAAERDILKCIQEYYDFSVQVYKPIYMCVASKVIDIQGILSSMGKVKWDVNHISVQHSAYIDTMNRSIQTFAMRLEDVSKEIQIHNEIIWDCLAHVSTHLLVEGFSNVKKCSAGGRALMQLDFTHFLSIIELISGKKFSMHRNYVDQFIKVYYYPMELFEEWIIQQKDKNDYSFKQLTNLILCVCLNDKRSKQKLLTIMGNINNEITTAATSSAESVTTEKSVSATASTTNLK